MIFKHSALADGWKNFSILFTVVLVDQMTYVEEACSNIFWSQSFSMSQWVTAICSSTLFLRYRIVTQSIVCTPPSSLWWTVVKMPCQSLPMNIWWDLDPEQWDRVDQPSFLRPSDRSPPAAAAAAPSGGQSTNLIGLLRKGQDTWQPPQWGGRILWN